MNQPKFLYGAAVQGIQGFIFQTNALREIAGGSELVEQICTTLFAEAIGISFTELENDSNAIVTAAGNIKYVFDIEENCAEVVRSFPKKVMEFAPGITVSQAVVKVYNGNIGKTEINELERRLRAQRNKQFRPFDVGLMAVNRSRNTGLPAVEFKKKEYTDLGVIRKRTAIESEEKESPKYSRLVTDFFGKSANIKLALDLKNITKSKNDNYSWLAVIHADGNNMGMALQKLASETEGISGDEYISTFRQFSLALDKSTKEAARKAYLEVMKLHPINSNDKLPFRPIVIGGDDLTIICRADLALEFTRLFLTYFKKESEELFKELPTQIDFLQKGLTACAGIAFIKESYPFHYGYHLAETLCTEAKIAAKNGLKPDELTPSCLMFHKVQASFVEDYKTIKERELKAGELRFDFGPYYIDKPDKPKIDELIECVSELQGKEGSAIKSHLRQWLTDLHNDAGLAEQKKLRAISMNKNKLKSLKIEKSENWTEKRTIKVNGEILKHEFTRIYDWLTIHSINQGGK
jgi:hypothetical protein